MWTFGILGRLDAVEDETTRFYAYIGLCVSTAAGIEQCLFYCFYQSSPLSYEPATAEFYKNVEFKRKRKLAAASVRSIFKDGSSRQTWDQLIYEVEQLCGPDGVRNLVSHNELGVDIFLPTNGDDEGPLLELSVSQNRHIISTGRRDPQRTNLESLRLYTADLTSLHLRMIEFHRVQLSNRK
tara:strand:- start:781 stop:1326 length:546 start_codon:yes stop_codon:yes gene_type:complete